MAFNSFSFKFPFIPVGGTAPSHSEPPEGVDVPESKPSSKVKQKVKQTTVTQATKRADASAEPTNQSKSIIQERRSSKRYPFHFDVVIMGAQRSIRTYSENISESGILVADLLPLEFNKEVLEILVIIKDQNGKPEYFLFHGKTIDSVIRSKRIQFVRTVANSKERLVQLFENLKGRGIE